MDLHQLQNLDVDKNRIKGTFPSTYTLNTQLLRLDINFNSMSGNLHFLSQFSNLKEAHLDSNNFDGTIPSAIGNLYDLRESSLFSRLSLPL